MQSVWKGWIIAGVAAFAWCALVAAWWASTTAEQGAGLFALLAAIVPTGLIAVLAVVFKRLAATRSQLDDIAQRINAQPTGTTAALTRPEIDVMFQKLSARQQVSDRALLALLEGRAADRTVLAEVAENTARAATVRPRAVPRVTPIAKREAGQPSLPLNEPDTAVESDPPPWADLVRALNFPLDQDDAAGFRAMHRAMRDRQVAQVLRAAEDVLNLMSQDGIYMDDLKPVASDPSLWRQFAEGTRGAEMSGLAAINDQTALSLTRGRMRSDDVMRDAVLHFIRHFDILLKSICARVDDDDEVARLADTRTGRAFMLLATVAGALD
ncbi:hypothetical protein SAMN06273572_103102 [Monaibacterium marinum]|uniref:Uncharacterized protein n=1 Tax=Pontivivens marinum TaxID=1690039 RepID=A0A2C9CSD5_9RHOB|nr:hypothetical protein [Monaibacterium marinum]SOH94075.1 hypothetical protein SAMN06273572_103102 [Monaibacterium marinum]